MFLMLCVVCVSVPVQGGGCSVGSAGTAAEMENLREQRPDAGATAGGVGCFQRECWAEGFDAVLREFVYPLTIAVHFFFFFCDDTVFLIHSTNGATHTCQNSFAACTHASCSPQIPKEPIEFLDRLLPNCGNRQCMIVDGYDT